MENHRVRSARSQDAVRRNRAQLEAKCLRAQNIRRRGRIEILHVSMPRELKSRPSTSPTHHGSQGMQKFFVSAQAQKRMQSCMIFKIVKKASCGIRAHDLPLTERVLCQLS